MKKNLLGSLIVGVLLLTSFSSNAQVVTHHLGWRNLSNLWWAVFPNDPQPLCLGNMKQADLGVYQCIDGNCSRLSYIDCQYTGGTVQWQISGGGYSYFYGCISQLENRILWTQTGDYTASASLNFNGTTIYSKDPYQLRIAVWKPYLVTADSTDLLPGAGTTVRVIVTPQTTNFHGPAPMTLWATGVDNSGGHMAGSPPNQHIHVNGLPAGTFGPNPPEGMQPGYVQSTYTAGIYSQIEMLRARACDVDANGLGIFVRVPNLVTITPSSEYNLIGQNEWHPENHYLTSATKIILLITIAYYNSSEGVSSRVGINDCSLIWGGKFDIAHNWTQTGSHISHRLGRTVDLRYRDLTSHERTTLQQWLSYFNGTWAIHDPGTSNAHYHVEY